MIKTFEEFTEDLTPDERKLAWKMADGFFNHVGKAQAITNREIIAAMDKQGVKLSDAKVRKIVNFIRVSGLVPCLVASSAGYYVAANADEMRDSITSLSQRVSAIAQVRDSLQKQASEKGWA